MSSYTLYSLCSKVRLITTGNLISAPIYLDLEIPSDLVDLSGVEELTIISLTENATTLFRWNGYFASGFTRNTELATGPFPLGSLLSGTSTFTSARSAPYNTVTNFLPASRFLIGYGNNSGTAYEQGVVSFMLGVKRING